MSYLVEYKRISVFIAALFVTAMLFLSGFFIVTQSEHECIGEECPVCAELQACIATIRLITEAMGAGSGLPFVFIIVHPLFSLLFQSGLNLSPVSLVNLKIRLDN